MSTHTYNNCHLYTLLENVHRQWLTRERMFISELCTAQSHIQNLKGGVQSSRGLKAKSALKYQKKVICGQKGGSDPLKPQARTA